MISAESLTLHDLSRAPREAAFAPIGGEGLVQQTVRRLGEAIGLGVLKEGERLPPETELAARFEISAMTLRQALAMLREAGYIETRRGRGGGTVVKRATPFPPGRHALGGQAKLTADALRDLTDFRVAISGHAAGLAATRAHEDELAQLAELVAAMQTPVPYAHFRRLDSQLHLGVASAARSQRLVEAETLIQGELTPMLALSGDEPSRLSLSTSNQDHTALLDALMRRDGEAARHVMEIHVAGTAEMLLGLRLGMLSEDEAIR